MYAVKHIGSENDNKGDEDGALCSERWPVEDEDGVLLLLAPLEEPVDGVDGGRLGGQRGEGGVQLERLGGLNERKSEEMATVR